MFCFVDLVSVVAASCCCCCGCSHYVAAVVMVVVVVVLVFGRRIRIQFEYICCIVDFE